MCASARFPEDIPLRKISSQVIIKALIKFFTHVGMPIDIQSDQGSNFTTVIFQQVMHQLGSKQVHVLTSAYHPQSQGAFDSYLQILKTMIKAYCFDNQKDLDEGIHSSFTTREVVQNSLGFSSFEFVFCHIVCGPL